VLFFQAQYQCVQVRGCYECVLEGLKRTFHMHCTDMKEQSVSMHCTTYGT